MGMLKYTCMDAINILPGAEATPLQSLDQRGKLVMGIH